MGGKDYRLPGGHLLLCRSRHRIAGSCGPRDLALAKSYRKVFLQSERKISFIFASMTDCYYELDQGWRFTRINDQCLAYFGRNREAFIGQLFGDVFPEDQGLDFRGSVQERLSPKVLRSTSKCNPSLPRTGGPTSMHIPRKKVSQSSSETSPNASRRNLPCARASSAGPPPCQASATR